MVEGLKKKRVGGTKGEGRGRGTVLFSLPLYLVRLGENLGGGGGKSLRSFNFLRENGRVEPLSSLQTKTEGEKKRPLVPLSSASPGNQEEKKATTFFSAVLAGGGGKKQKGEGHDSYLAQFQRKKKGGRREPPQEKNRERKKGKG